MERRMTMDVKKCLYRAIPALFALALLMGLAISPAASDRETRYAFVVNQTNETIVLAYDEMISGNKARSQEQVYPGQTKRLDTTKVQGDVCAWDAREGSLEPAKKLDCRTLSPGDHWVIH
jgi:hypothetical protein